MALVFVDREYSHIECDVCSKHSPSAREMIEGHGLSNMGWFVTGGKHRCPDHYTEDTEPKGPIYRTSEEEKTRA